MREKLYHIPINDAFEVDEECPFCFLERKNEQEMLDFVLGSASSYMQSDIREQTDHHGFCRQHFQKMFQYGNTLGNAWILKTHYQKMLEEMKKISSTSGRGAKRTSGLIKKRYNGTDSAVEWIQNKKNSCYFCDGEKELQKRYLETFFTMYEKDKDFQKLVTDSKGFCLHHTQELIVGGYEMLPELKQEAFKEMLLQLAQDNLERVSEDISWLVDKFDYRNKEADWKNSKDALQRGMQKLWGGYPADSVYRQNK